MDDNLKTFLVIAALFPFIMIGAFLGIAKLSSLVGWQKFVIDQKGKVELPRDAKCVGTQGITFASRSRFSNARQTASIWLHPTDIFLKPLWIFSFSHPLIRLNWDDIFEIVEEQRLVGKVYEIAFSRELPFVVLTGKAGVKVRQMWREKYGLSDDQSKRMKA